MHTSFPDDIFICFLWVEIILFISVRDKASQRIQASEDEDIDF